MPTTADGFALFESALGQAGIAWRGALIVAVQLPEADADATRARMQRRLPGVPETEPPSWVAAVASRTAALLGGTADDLLDVPLDLAAVPRFHRRVYELARRIPPGSMRTYGELAAELGEPGAARAVGHALGLNPFAPIVPCHRILAAGGHTGGFSAPGGTRTKMKMLEAEGAFAAETLALFAQPLDAKPVGEPPAGR
jgi:methylated-DNA-[protein]-cysteine S-methyltransferase